MIAMKMTTKTEKPKRINENVTFKQVNRVMADFQSRNRAASGDTAAVMCELERASELEKFTVKVGHCEHFCDTGIAFLQDKHCGNSFGTLTPMAFSVAECLGLSLKCTWNVFSQCSD